MITAINQSSGNGHSPSKSIGPAERSVEDNVKMLKMLRSEYRRIAAFFLHYKKGFQKIFHDLDNTYPVRQHLRLWFKNSSKVLGTPKPCWEQDGDVCNCQKKCDSLSFIPEFYRDVAQSLLVSCSEEFLQCCDDYLKMKSELRDFLVAAIIVCSRLSFSFREFALGTITGFKSGCWDPKALKSSLFNAKLMSEEKDMKKYFVIENFRFESALEKLNDYLNYFLIDMLE